MTILKKLNIDLLEPVYTAKIFKTVESDKFTFYTAEIYDFGVHLSTLHVYNEQDLRNQLKKIYNIDYLTSRTFENFVIWYEKITEKKLTEKKLKNIKKKFDYSNK